MKSFSVTFSTIALQSVIERDTSIHLHIRVTVNVMWIPTNSGVNGLVSVIAHTNCSCSCRCVGCCVGGCREGERSEMLESLHQ